MTEDEALVVTPAPDLRGGRRNFAKQAGGRSRASDGVSLRAASRSRARHAQHRASPGVGAAGAPGTPGTRLPPAAAGSSLRPVHTVVASSAAIARGWDAIPLQLDCLVVADRSTRPRAHVDIWDQPMSLEAHADLRDPDRAATGPRGACRAGPSTAQRWSCRVVLLATTSEVTVF